MNAIRFICCLVCTFFTIPLIALFLKVMGSNPDDIFSNWLGGLIAITTALFWYTVFEDK